MVPGTVKPHPALIGWGFGVPAPSRNAGTGPGSRAAASSSIRDCCLGYGGGLTTGVATGLRDAASLRQPAGLAVHGAEAQSAVRGRPPARLAVHRSSTRPMRCRVRRSPGSSCARWSRLCRPRAVRKCSPWGHPLVSACHWIVQWPGRSSITVNCGDASAASSEGGGGAGLAALRTDFAPRHIAPTPTAHVMRIPAVGDTANTTANAPAPRTTRTQAPAAGLLTRRSRTTRRQPSSQLRRGARRRTLRSLRWCRGRSRTTPRP